MPNVIVSPHTAFYTEEVVACMLSCNFNSLKNYESGLADPQEIKL
jgi:phosphoglycerate dehydrogenase-like enzyme